MHLKFNNTTKKSSKSFFNTTKTKFYSSTFISSR